MKSKVIPYLMLIALASVPYLNTLKGSFVYDDSEMVLENPNVRGETTLAQTFFDKRVMSFSGEIYRPLRDISYRIDYLIGGKGPFTYHATNILLHVIATVAAYLFLLQLFKDEKISFLSAALFAVHPIHTESVAWIKGRDDILFTIFYLLSFLMYIRYEDKAGWIRRVFYLASISLFVLSLFTKEMAVTLPLAIAIYQAIFKRLKFYDLLPFFIVAAIYMGLRTYVLGQVAQQEYWGGGFMPTMLTMVKGVAEYLRLCFLPINQCADYFSFPISKSLDLWAILSFLFLLAVLGCLLKSHDRFALWGGLLFFITLLPALNIVPIKILIAERFLYLPILGFCIAVASGLRMVLADKGLRVMGTVLVCAFSLLAFQRNYVWSDEYSLWSDTLRKAPGNPRAHYGMGTSYASKGMLDEAIKEFKESIRIAPYAPDPFSALGLAYYKKGMVEESVESYAEYRKTKGLVSYYKKGQVEDAIIQYQKALKLDPSHREARYNLALLYYEQGQIDDAIREYNELLRFKPDDFEALNSLGLAYFQKGLFEEALLNYNVALNIDPESVSPYNNIGIVYAVMGQKGDAENWFKKALEIDPKSAEAYYNLGFLYQKEGRSGEAATAFKTAIGLKPDYEEAKRGLKESESTPEHFQKRVL